jgi:hypothetical protein
MEDGINDFRLTICDFLICVVEWLLRSNSERRGFCFVGGGISLFIL